MKLKDLYTRIVETTGLEVLTVESINAAISNCFADLTSRGYREFEEKKYEKDLAVVINDNKIKFALPTDLRSILYCKVYFLDGANKVERISLTNPHIDTISYQNELRSDLARMGKKIIYYTKKDEIFIEWWGKKELIKMELGYHKKLIAPSMNPDKILGSDISELEVDIRKEFEDAVVLYACYFFIARELKDQERMQFHLNQYKYYVEDILHELADEDNFEYETVMAVE